jgi:hypothetical protein
MASAPGFRNRSAGDAAPRRPAKILAAHGVPVLDMRLPLVGGPTSRWCGGALHC